MPNCRLWPRVLPPMRAWLWWKATLWWRATNCLAPFRLGPYRKGHASDLWNVMLSHGWIFLVNEVPSRIPPLITRYDKSIQTPTFISNPLEKHLHYFAGHHPLLTLDGFNLVHNCSTLRLFSFIAKPLPASSKSGAHTKGGEALLVSSQSKATSCFSLV
ncbi:hypothetical protein TNCV_3789261 [Trichonephila clavipes]|nr:hypothetical protein TNCV_3789261 [Trichonephila clavipes]